MKKQKVLLDTRLVLNGGTENVLQNLANFLMERDNGNRYDVTVAAFPKNYQDFYKAFPKGIRFIRREFAKKGYKRYSPQWFLEVLINRAYAFVISCYLNLLHFDISIAIVPGKIMKRNSRLHAKHKFFWVQRDYRDFRPWGSLSYGFQTPEAELRYMKRYEKVVCVSETARRGILETVGDPGNLCVKYNPINVNLIRRMAKEGCSQKKQPGKFLIITMGRLHPEKQPLFLLQLCKSLSMKHDLEVWLLGEGEQRRELEEYIEREQLSFVKLLRFQANPYPYLCQADLYVSCSSSESYGLSIQEALVLNVPVAAIRCPGVEESLDPRFGVMAENSFQSMEAVLQELLDHPEKLREYRERIQADYPIADLYEKRLESICKLWE